MAPNEGSITPIFPQSLNNQRGADGYGAGLGYGSVSGVPITMSAIDGSNFALSSLDISEIFFGYGVNILVTGFMDDGGTVDLLIEGLFPGTPEPVRVNGRCHPGGDSKPHLQRPHANRGRWHRKFQVDRH